MGVLGVTMAYGLFRMFYIKSVDFSSGIYALDLLSVIMTIVALAPATVKFAMAGRIVSRLQAFSDDISELLSHVVEFQRLTRRSTIFIQEAELIHRGFTM